MGRHTASIVGELRQGLRHTLNAVANVNFDAALVWKIVMWRRVEARGGALPKLPILQFLPNLENSE